MAADDDDDDDPFTRHFAYDLSPELIACLTDRPPLTDETVFEWPELGKLLFRRPRPAVVERRVAKPLEETRPYARVPESPPEIAADVGRLGLHRRLRGLPANADRLQLELLSVMTAYHDLGYPERSADNAESVRRAYCAHALDHVLKSRDAVATNDDRDGDDRRDQGLTRTKVLILAPFKDSAYRTVNAMVSLLSAGADNFNVVHRNRFADEFTGGELTMPRKNPKPEDYERTFAGNVDDAFRLGVAVTKSSLKLYENFYASDIVIASPLGLRMVVGAEGEASRDYDFLSSVEVLILDQCDVFLMQNWDHVLHVMDHLHLQPREAHGTDLQRVRNWSISGLSKHFRQTLMFSSCKLPSLMAVMKNRCANYAGSVTAVNPIVTGSIGHVVGPLKQFYHRLSASTPSESINDRFEYFARKVLTQIRSSGEKHVLVYVPSYFDYVCIRNHLKTEDYSFVQINEYTKPGKVARARDLFYHGQCQILLYSERYHFYNRARIRGVDNIVFYQLPTFAGFYSELCNLIRESDSCTPSVTALYSNFDACMLSSIVGTQRAKYMLSSEQKIHMFHSGV